MLPPRRREVLGFVRSFVKDAGRPPTVREVQEHFGFASPNAAQSHIAALRSAGYLRVGITGARSIVPTRLDDQLPIYGTIPAGLPVDAMEEKGETIAISVNLFGGKPTERVFGLRVRGTSMTRAGILDGDIAIVADRPAADGDIVAALVDGESTLKRYVIRRGRVVLKPEGVGFREIIPTAELLIQGVMIGLIRCRA